MDIEKLWNSRRVTVWVIDHTKINSGNIVRIMKDNNLSLTQMGLVLGVKPETIKRWVARRAIPNTAKMLIALIDEHPEVIDMIMKHEVQGERL